MCRDAECRVPRNRKLKGGSRTPCYGVPNWTRAQHDCWRVTIKYVTATGTRKNEYAEAFDGDTFVRRGNITPFIGGELVQPTPAGMSHDTRAPQPLIPKISQART